MFDDAFVLELSEDALDSAIMVCDQFFKVHKSFGGSRKQKANIESYFKALTFAEVFIEARKINYGPIPNIESSSKDFDETAIKKICDFFTEWQEECSRMQQLQNLESTFSDAKEEYASMLGRTIAYELSEEGYHKIHCLLKEITEEVSESNSIDDDHKKRLLNKFKKLQEKLSIRMHHFDGFWGMFVDVWVLVGKNHSASKELTKSAQQIINIIWAVQSDTEDIKKASPIVLLAESKKAVLAK